MAPGPAVEIGEAREDEREWAAHLMAGSDPWTTLGRGLDGSPDEVLMPRWLRR